MGRGFESRPGNVTSKCTCKGWYIVDPEYDPSCPNDSHAELAFTQRGWVMVCP